MLLLAESDGVLHQCLTRELADVEARFAAELRSDLECVNQLAAHVERYRGKMLRPMLVLVSAMATAPQRDRPSEAHRVVATVVEMVHMATLVHDDILDEAIMRRRGATINHLSGNEAAVMLGDYLISHAYHLCSALGRPSVSRAIAAATNTVCEGELLQLSYRNDWALDEETYFEIIRRKTASLAGVCCRVAAEVSHADEPVPRALNEYGEKLGIAFQIVDDLLDLTGEERTVGKTLGRDLEKGKLTLPLIHALAAPGGEAKHRLLTRVANWDDQTDPLDRDGQVRAIRDWLDAAGSVDYARERARQLIDEAKAAAEDHLPDSPGRALMLKMADAVLDRQF
ncbi:MAG: polyprenyl synthetase family protein [Phycisphaeraceae bacterium]